MEISGTDASGQPNKLLLKLNRQERAIEESKVALKPYYSRRVIDKSDYKDILRKAVPKVGFLITLILDNRLILEILFLFRFVTANRARLIPRKLKI